MSTTSTSSDSIKKNDSKSTAEGEWEMRDGKWYRRDYYSLGQSEKKETIKVKCPNCPMYQEKVVVITKERDELRTQLKEREHLISDQRGHLEKWDFEAKNWAGERQRYEFRIQELESRLRDKETLTLQLNDRIKILISEKEAQSSDADSYLLSIRKFEQTISSLEEQINFCRANHSEKEKVVEEPKLVRWYYAVQNPHFAQLWQTDPNYKGGDVVIDPLEGATIVNPEYYRQSENVPGNARLRVRVVDVQNFSTAISAAFPSMSSNTEIFVRLKLGEATQFTQARPAGMGPIIFHQDHVFVEIPLKPHGLTQLASCSVHTLVVEVVSRQIGGTQETLLGSSVVDLAELVIGITRTLTVDMPQGFSVSLRIKAMDFGLPLPGTSATAKLSHQEFAEHPRSIKSEVYSSDMHQFS